MQLHKRKLGEDHVGSDVTACLLDVESRFNVRATSLETLSVVSGVHSVFNF